MIGGLGDDNYVVNAAGDTVTELANQGVDTIFSAISFNLSINGTNVENLTLSGAGALIGTGNVLDNLLTGNAGVTILSGGAGNDVLDGGLGADSLTGGAGSDLFLYRLANTVDLANLGGDTITDFESGKDKIDLFDLLNDFGVSTADPFTDGFLKLEASGTDTVVKFDSDGGGNSFVTLVAVQNVTVTGADLVF